MSEETTLFYGTVYNFNFSYVQWFFQNYRAKRATDYIDKEEGLD
jgi:hypothetical protein